MKRQIPDIDPSLVGAASILVTKKKNCQRLLERGKQRQLRLRKLGSNGRNRRNGRLWYNTVPSKRSWRKLAKKPVALQDWESSLMPRVLRYALALISAPLILTIPLIF